jgi:spore germination protein KC
VSILKKAINILFIIVLVLSLSGCWNRRELNTLAIVMGIGIDQGKKENEMDMTVQLVDTSSMKSTKSSSSGGDSGSGSAYLNLKGSGSDLMSILRGFTHQISRKLYVAHNQVIVFGEDLAKQGIHDSLDFLLRDHECRLTVNVLVARGKASDIFDAEPQLEKIPMADINKRIELQGASSETAKLSVVDFMTHLTSNTFSAVAPLVEIKNDNGKKVSLISGGAVFKKDKLVGELSKTQTRGYLWVMDKVKSGVIKVDVNDQKVNLEIIKSTRKVTPILKEDGSIEFKIKIVESGSISSQTGNENMSTAENAKLIEKEVEKQIKSEIQSAIDRAKELDSDIFGFGESIHRKSPEKWKSLEQDWDKLFKTLSINIDVKATVVAGGRLAKPDYPE